MDSGALDRFVFAGIAYIAHRLSHASASKRVRAIHSRMALSRARRRESAYGSSRIFSRITRMTVRSVCLSLFEVLEIIARTDLAPRAITDTITAAQALAHPDDIAISHLERALKANKRGAEDLRTAIETMAGERHLYM